MVDSGGMNRFYKKLRFDGKDSSRPSGTVGRIA